MSQVEEDEVLNCWEYMDCGREPGGRNVTELGVCPAAVQARFDGVNRGKNSGRFCWVVAGTFCRGEVQGTWAKKFRNCLQCRFYLEVERQQGRSLVLTEEDIR